MTQTCRKCKISKEISAFAKSGNNRIRTDCKKCCNDYYKIYRENQGKQVVIESNRRSYHKNKETLKYRYLRLKTGSKQRNKEFNISLEDFKKLWLMRCYYCDDEVTTAGLDRVNSSKGYIIDNIVRCCERCNRAKNDLSVNDFINHCRKIIKKHDSDPSTNKNSTR